jgi:hypothetical protein
MSIQSCPTCDTPVSVAKAREIELRLTKQRTELEATVAKEIQAKHRAEVLAATQETERRLTEVANKRIAVVISERDRLRKNEIQIEVKHRRELLAATQAAENRSKAEAAKQLANVISERDSFRQKAKEMEQREASVKKRLQEDAERKIKQAQQESEQRVKKELIEQRQILDKHKDNELLKQQSTFNREREAYQKKLKEMERRVERKTANELGDGAEIDLHEALREAFPDDRITRIQKGKPGADILHEVLHRGQCCGQIIYDSKNHLRWHPTFVAKLQQDQKEAEAEYAVLSTTEFPKGEKGICLKNGVIIVSPVNVVHVVRVLRNSMTKVYQLGLSAQERQGKMSRLYTFITSEKFVQRLAMANQLTGQMEEIDVQEKKSHDSTWKQRGILNKRMANVIAEIDTEISAILHGIDMRPAA